MPPPLTPSAQRPRSPEAYRNQPLRQRESVVRVNDQEGAACATEEGGEKNEETEERAQQRFNSESICPPRLSRPEPTPAKAKGACAAWGVARQPHDAQARSPVTPPNGPSWISSHSQTRPGRIPTSLRRQQLACACSRCNAPPSSHKDHTHRPGKGELSVRLREMGHVTRKIREGQRNRGRRCPKRGKLVVVKFRIIDGYMYKAVRVVKAGRTTGLRVDLLYASGQRSQASAQG